VQEADLPVHLSRIARRPLDFDVRDSRQRPVYFLVSCRSIRYRTRISASSFLNRARDSHLDSEALLSRRRVYARNVIASSYLPAKRRSFDRGATMGHLAFVCVCICVCMCVCVCVCVRARAGVRLFLSLFRRETG
jgi:hypothetical protein